MFSGKTVSVGTALACTALLLAGCGGSSQDTSGPTDTSEPAAALGSPGTVTVFRPGMLDTDLSPGDVPDWPGPAPADFLGPGSPSCERGELTGEDAELVHDAAVDHPEALLQDGQDPREASGALWSVDDNIEWLVVEPSSNRSGE